jgi:outer membrane protein, protease secretion system
VDQSRAFLQQIKNTQAEQLITLSQLSNTSVGTVYPLQEIPSTLPVIPTDWQAAWELAQMHNPNRQRLVALEDLTQHALKARQADKLPTLDANAGLNRSRVSGTGTSTASVSDRSIGLALNLPLWTGGRLEATEKQAAATFNKSQLEREDNDLTLKSALQTAYQSLGQAQAQYAAQQRVLKSAQSTYEALLKAFKAGFRSNIDLLNAQQQIYGAQRALSRAKADDLIAQITVLSLTGQLLQDDVVTQIQSRFFATPTP